MAVLFVLPRATALTVVAVAVGTSDLILHGRGLLRSLFNTAQTTIALALASFSMALFGAPVDPAGSQTFLLHPLATIAPILVFSGVNTALVAGVLALESRGSFGVVWKRNYWTRQHALSTATLYFMGLGLVLSVEAVGYVVGLAYLPLLLAARATYGQLLNHQASALPSR
jgi:hypothetical protein